MGKIRLILAVFVGLIFYPNAIRAETEIYSGIQEIINHSDKNIEITLVASTHGSAIPGNAQFIKDNVGLNSLTINIKPNEIRNIKKKYFWDDKDCYTPALFVAETSIKEVTKTGEKRIGLYIVKERSNEEYSSKFVVQYIKHEEGIMLLFTYNEDDFTETIVFEP